MTTSKPEGKRRHRWGQETRGQNPNECLNCLALRTRVLMIDMRKARTTQWALEYAWPDGRAVRRLRADGVPPCSGVKP